MIITYSPFFDNFSFSNCQPYTAGGRAYDGPTVARLLLAARKRALPLLSPHGKMPASFLLAPEEMFACFTFLPPLGSARIFILLPSPVGERSYIYPLPSPVGDRSYIYPLPSPSGEGGPLAVDEGENSLFLPALFVAVCCCRAYPHQSTSVTAPREEAFMISRFP